jgi:glycosyltransferase involved in cell wall biosynthesis
MLFAGDGPDREALERATPPDLRARVHFVGHTDPVPYLAASDVFALPSAIESFGVAYAEAMAMGLPCVGLRYDPPAYLSSAEDVISHGETGFVVDNEQEFVTVLSGLANDKAGREAAGTRARARARASFSDTSYVDFLENLVADLHSHPERSSLQGRR